MIWNAKIAENEYYYEFGRKFFPANQWQASKENKKPDFAFFDQSYSQFKNDESTPWLSDCPSQILRNSAVLWFETQWKYIRGECGAPKRKSRDEGGSIHLTRELFRLEKRLGKWTLWIGTKTNNIGFLEVNWHRNDFAMPNSIRVKRLPSGKWRVSFSYDDGAGVDIDAKGARTVWLKSLAEMSESDLSQIVEGVDRGVVNPVSTTKADHGFEPEQLASLKRTEARKKKFQRQLARRQKGSRRRQKTKLLIARLSEKQSHIRKDMAHQITRRIVNDEVKQVFILEDLKIKNMTASAAGTIEDPGRNVAQKSGLNREILNVNWGMIDIFLTYKALRQGKIVFKTNPQHSSQECAHCSHIHPDNRLSQAEFRCVHCGHVDNADRNAAKVLAKRAVKLFLSSGTELRENGTLVPAHVSDGGLGGRRNRRALKTRSKDHSSSSRLKREWRKPLEACPALAGR